MSPPGPDQRSANFATTQWSLVASAGNRHDTQGAAALAMLCQRYWFPLYAFVRRRGYGVPEAEDLVQGFFARVIEKDVLTVPTIERGRFRNFLLGSLKNFLANEHDRQHTIKRGANVRWLPLDAASSETRLAYELIDNLTPERLYERQWALTLLQVATQQLAAEYTAAGKQQQFEWFQHALVAEAQVDYAQITAISGMTHEAARQAVSRLRRRFQQVVREQVLQTVTDPSDAEDEIRSLLQAFAPS